MPYSGNLQCNPLYVRLKKKDKYPTRNELGSNLSDSGNKMTHTHTHTQSDKWVKESHSSNSVK